MKKTSTLLIFCAVLALISTNFAFAADNSQQGIDHQHLVFWFQGDKSFRDSISGMQGVPHGDVRIGPGVGDSGTAAWLDGSTGGISFPDMDSLKLKGSLTISVLLYVLSIPPGSNLAGQILFRGDDRVGNDPYTLDLNPNGTYQFHIEAYGTNNEYQNSDIYCPCALKQWTLLTATFDAIKGEMRLYLNGVKVTEDTTPYLPFIDLDPNSLPGIGIGDNNGFGKSAYHERFNGAIEDLRVYDRALAPGEIHDMYIGKVGIAQIVAQDSSVGPGRSTQIAFQLSVPAPKGGLTVNLSSSNTRLVTVPDTVLIPAGQTVGQFAATVAPQAGGAGDVTVSANAGSSVKSVTVHVQP